MWVKELTAINFKNYAEVSLAFTPGVNAFTGDNGAGKTNILDALHYLSLCKSYFNPIDSQQIKQGTDFFMLQAVFVKDEQHDLLACSLKRNQKKQFRRNKKDYQRLADHIGVYPLVMITPNDSVIVTDGSEERRKFIDNVISQTDNRYLDDLIFYNKCLLSRNMVLKQQTEAGRYDDELLGVYNEQLVSVGQQIFEKRKSFMSKFVKIFNNHYRFLTDDVEKVELVYESQLLQKDFKLLLQESIKRDRALERTTTGIHKDELTFSISGMPLKKFGSQGQQKSFLIALKLAQYSFLCEEKGFKPLLLLDDIFDKLDEKRIKKLMKMVSDDDFGQIFITDTSTERVENTFRDIAMDVRIFEVVSGTIDAAIKEYGQNE
ncbi:DNA replication/repair protein RecF [Olivibacter sp. SDN3]|uniref:DNA replication/repair protein RecF n=1 Tax=Olivibacter sp. SDN3 TaxID=2764720 RepID=UPI001651B082|nr:DNA replication/repair protein RecF [Olivibacter sp. SDN3]QNL50051.1 DNA replication/repair protein RecF [Olivibacter sp. SDN3]